MVRKTELKEQPLEERLEFHRFITSACTHLYSKGKFQKDKFDEIAPYLTKMAKLDPIFFAHVTSWAMKQESKDLQVLTVFFNSLNDADGTPFFLGSGKRKPNLRIISSAALQMLSPHLALRVLELTRVKFGVDDYLAFGGHYSSMIKTAFRKYIKFREMNLDVLMGIRTKGLRHKMINIYRLSHIAPSNEAASILAWNQKGKKIDKMKFDFSDMNSTEIVKEITTKKISPLIVLAVLPVEKLNLTVVKGLLKNCTGNQALILQNMFRNKGFLDVPEFKELFDKKISKATTTIDRVDTLAKDLTDKDKESLVQVRSKKRKEQLGQIGKIFLHIDASYSMQNAIEFAKENASIIAECVNDPKENFRWGIFGSGYKGRLLPVPDEFTKEDFHEKLYGVRADSSSTNCVGCYPLSRQFGADVDVYFTDQQHNCDDVINLLNRYHDEIGTIKPKAAIIVDFSNRRYDYLLKEPLENFGIPVTILDPDSLKESALVAQAVKNAIKGQSAIVDEILDTPLLQLPRWWNQV